MICQWSLYLALPKTSTHDTITFICELIYATTSPFASNFCALLKVAFLAIIPLAKVVCLQWYPHIQRH